MEWLLANPQIHSTFSSLAAAIGDKYVISTDATAILEDINCKLACEDQTLRTFRRAIGLGQNVKIDIVPFLINAKDPNALDAVIRILVNLTVPVECLFSVDVMYRTEVGRHTIFELNKLLITSKDAFTEPKSTKSIVDYMKSILESDKKLSIDQCNSINNCLLLLRNILHIPEDNVITQGTHSSSSTSMQNTILWNLFTQSIDKLLIYLMSCSQRSFWGVTMVQLIAIIYKDQHVCTLQKLLSLWFDASLSESSNDNESNTSPPMQGRGDSSPMLTSNSTSDSSDNDMTSQEEHFLIGGGGQESNVDRLQVVHHNETRATPKEVIRKGQDYQKSIDQESLKRKNLAEKAVSAVQGDSSPVDGKVPPSRPQKTNMLSSDSPIDQQSSDNSTVIKTERSNSQAELSDYGYGTQVENQGSISNSSNEDEGPRQKPVHQKPPCNQKQRYNCGKKPRNVITAQEKKDLRRKKLVKRSKSNLINMKGLVQHIPTDEDISNILKEYIVDFLLKGYGYLVQDLHAQLLSDFQVQIDTSHFFWLVSYFLKFAPQLELDVEPIKFVLSYNVVSYLTYEAVNICEQLDLTRHQKAGDLRPHLRRMHLVVTAIREILQSLENYKTVTHLTQEDRQHLQILQLQIAGTEDLRNLFVLLLRKYDSTLHTKQYLQDIIVTNNMFLLLVEDCNQYSENVNSNICMAEHISQFATIEIMHHYGLLLEGFRENSASLNNCIFTMMHHVGGDLGQITTLFQPVILKTFSKIWESECVLCDDWYDLIEYVIHKFMNTPQKTPLSMQSPSLTEMTKEYNMEHTACPWTQEEIDTLYWYYVQSKKVNDVVGKIVKFFVDNGNKQKSRISIIQQLLQQDIINLVEYDDLMKYEDVECHRKMTKISQPSTNTGESKIEVTGNNKDTCKPSDDIQFLKNLILKKKNAMSLVWLQKVLLDCCNVKLALSSRFKPNSKHFKSSVLEPIPYNSILKRQSIPLVPWNSEQSAILSYQPFILLLHKLGFHLPADAGKLFIRIPEFWTADILYATAQKLGPINESLIKFDIGLLNEHMDPEEMQITPEEIQVKDEEMEDLQVIDEEMEVKEDGPRQEGFAYPQANDSKSIIRFTPDGESTPSVPNWLQVVMRSKCISADRIDNQVSSISASITKVSVQPPPVRSTASTSKIYQNCKEYEDDSILDTDDESNLSQRREFLEIQYRAMVAEVSKSEENSNFETASMASDLTRMYVSDEDDKASIGPLLEL